MVGAGQKSKKVGAEVRRLVAALGPELGILTEADPDDLRRAGGSLLAEAVGRLRRGEVRREAGYDGEYGVIALFGPGELDRGNALFDLASPASPTAKPHSKPAHNAGRPPGPPGQRKARLQQPWEADSSQAAGEAAATAHGRRPAQAAAPRPRRNRPDPHPRAPPRAPSPPSITPPP